MVLWQLSVVQSERDRKNDNSKYILIDILSKVLLEDFYVIYAKVLDSIINFPNLGIYEVLWNDLFGRQIYTMAIPCNSSKVSFFTTAL